MPASVCAARQEESRRSRSAELLALLERDSSLVSPGVLARPAIQDAVLGTTLQIMGPGETAYLAQAAAVYPVLGVAAPWTALRPQVLVFDRRQREHLAELGAGLEELLFAPESDRHIGSPPLAGGGFVAAARADAERLLDGLRAPAIALDPTLEKPWTKTRDTLLGALDAFAAKVEAAAARRGGVAQQRFDQPAPGDAPRRRAAGAGDLHRLVRRPLRRDLRRGAPRAAHARPAPARRHRSDRRAFGPGGRRGGRTETG